MRALLLVLWAAPFICCAAENTLDVGAHITQEDVASTLREVPAGKGTEQILRMVNVGRMDVGVAVMRRQPGKQGAVMHDQLTEVYHILAGSGVLVTGRKMDDPKRMDPEGKVVKELAGPSSSGPSIQDGHSQHFGPGDTVIIPAGVAHWFSSLDSTVDYLVVRIDPDRTIPIK
jgi:mannose-6-phosphate isomerase-like protein (cupin superfamily)